MSVGLIATCLQCTRLCSVKDGRCSSLFRRLFRISGMNRNCVCGIRWKGYARQQQHNAARFGQFNNHVFMHPGRSYGSVHALLSNSEEEFSSSFQSICNDLTAEKDIALSLVAKRLSVVLNYNVLGGKMSRGLMLVAASKMLTSSPLTSHELKLAHILGWCIELLQAFFLVTDDVMDCGVTRRGKPCWFQLPEVGLEAVNDALMLECCIYRLLKMHFEGMECYTNILDEFHEVTQKTVWGQCLDMAGNPAQRRPRIDVFKPEYYWKVVENKTAFYSFCLPVHLAMHLISSVKSHAFHEDQYAKAEGICLNLGRLFQMQDDYLDVYGDSAVTGKLGTDIREGKCTWLAVTALENCSEDERKVMEAKYGIDDPAAVKEIMQLYDSLSIRQKYYDMENKMHAEISSLINKLNDQVLKKDFFFAVLNSIYKRKK